MSQFRKQNILAGMAGVLNWVEHADYAALARQACAIARLRAQAEGMSEQDALSLYFKEKLAGLAITFGLLSVVLALTMVAALHDVSPWLLMAGGVFPCVYLVSVNWLYHKCRRQMKT